MPVWGFLAFALAAARLTGLATVDTITDPLRDRLLTRLGSVLDPPEPAHLAATTLTLDRLYETHRRRWLIGKLATCQWCAGLWVSAAVVPIAWWHGTNPWALIPALILATSQIVGMLSDLGRG